LLMSALVDAGRKADALKHYAISPPCWRANSQASPTRQRRLWQKSCAGTEGGKYWAPSRPQGRTSSPSAPPHPQSLAMLRTKRQHDWWWLPAKRRASKHARSGICCPNTAGRDQARKALLDGFWRRLRRLRPRTRPSRFRQPSER
jgi:hypothetical protein